MSLPVPPNISQGQIALDPVNGVVYYKDDNGDLVATTWSWLRDDVANISTDDEVLIDADLTVAGDLIIQGDTVSLNVAQVLIEDNILVLNSNYTGAPVLNAGIEVERGSEPNVLIRWNELDNKWQFTNDGTTYLDLNSIIENSVTLGLHTVGEYVKNITAGTGVSVTMPSGEGATPTISIGQDVSIGATVNFSRVIAPITGNLTGDVAGNVSGNLTGNVTGNLTGDVTGDVTGNLTGDVTGNLTGNVTGNLTGNVAGQISDLTNHGINSLNDVDATPSSNQFLKWNGSQWVNDFIDLTTDTIGDYVGKLEAGTGVFISSNSGEGATPLISIGQDVSTGATVNFSRVIAPITGNLTGNVTGNLTGNVTGNLTGDVTGNVSGNLTGNVTGNLTGDVTGDLTGDVTGQVSDISNHSISDLGDVTITDVSNGDFLRYNGANWINDPVNLTTDTVGDYVAKLAAGTGITITNNSGEGSTPNISFSGSIDNITDVVITSAQNGQILEYDGTAWVNTVHPSSEPIGHENKDDSVISFDEGSRQFSIAPASTSYTVWCTGKRYVKTSTETVTIPDTSGLYYIYFNSSGSLAYKTTFFTWDQDTPTAYIYWNQDDDKAYFFADERHGVTLDWATHEYLHRTRGAAIANGFGANNYTLTGDGSLDAHAQIDIADGTFFDEDLQVDITHSASPTANTWQQRLQSGAYIPVFYRSNSSWKKDTATQFPVKNSGTTAQYNLNSAGTWSATAIDNSKYGVMFIVATNNLNEPVLAIMGQAQYTDKGSAEASTWDELDLAGFPVVEFRPLYKIVFQTANAYANTPKTKFVNLLDLRQVISAGAGSSSAAVSDHGSMTGLSDDDHPQYLHLSQDRTVTATPTFSSGIISSGPVNTNRLIVNGIEIETATPSDTNVLKYNAALNKYVPGVASTVASLDDLTDVVISAATPNQIIKYDGTNWVNANAPSGTLGTTYMATIGDGTSTSFVLTHGLSTRDIVVSFTETASPYSSFTTSWEATNLNTITVYFEEPPSNNSIRVSIFAAVSGISYPSLSGSMYSGYHGDGINTEVQVPHGLGTQDIFLQIRNANSPYEVYDVAWEATNNNIATLYFDAAPSLNSVYVMIYAALSGVSSTSLSGLTDTTFVGLANGDFLRYNGSEWINDPVNLSTDTVGDYVKFLVGGTGVSIIGGVGEGSTPTISIAQDVSVSATPNFAVVYATNFIGNVTGTLTGNVVGQVSTLSNHSIDNLSDVTISDAANGDFLRYNGAAWINDPVNLSTDTVGDYVKSLVAGSGITITDNSGEGATPTISAAFSLSTLDDTSLSTPTIYDSLQYDGNDWINSSDLTTLGSLIFKEQIPGPSYLTSGTISVHPSGQGLYLDQTTFINALKVNNIQIDPTGALTNQVLTYDGTKFVAGAVIASADTRDVEIKLAMDVN